jgi:hypothetical protein
VGQVLVVAQVGHLTQQPLADLGPVQRPLLLDQRLRHRQRAVLNRDRRDAAGRVQEQALVRRGGGEPGRAQLHVGELPPRSRPANWPAACQLIGEPGSTHRPADSSAAPSAGPTGRSSSSAGSRVRSG